MRPLIDRIAAYLANAPTETTIDHAYGRMLDVLARERHLLEGAILSPRLLPASSFRRLKAELSRLRDDIAWVEALRGRLRGDPPPKPSAQTPRPTTTDSGYGEW